MLAWTEPLVIVYVYAFVLGAVVGSFLNVVIHRVPRRLSIVRPGSACPACSGPIAWYDNLPLLSWLALRGRCRRCRAAISLRYPLVEATAGALSLFGVVLYGLTPVAVEVVIFGWVSLALALIDLEHQILPDVMTYPAIAFGLVYSWFGGFSTFVDSAAGAAVGAALPTTVILLYRWLRGVDGMGWGDVKYLAAIGAVVGLHGCLMVLVVAAVVGALVGGALIAVGRGSGKTALPFGTFLALAVIVWLYAPASWRALSLP
jgi:leader peptidase (prepilin peptidase)/N-methyltransferase